MSWQQIPMDAAFDRAESPIEQDVIVDLATTWRAVFVNAPLERFDDAVNEITAKAFNERPIVVATQVKIGKFRVDMLLGRKGEWNKTIIECDGHAFHRAHQWQANRDWMRDDDLAKRGLIVERLTGSEIFNHLSWEMAHLLYRRGLTDDLAQVFHCQRCIRNGHCDQDDGNGIGCKKADPEIAPPKSAPRQIFEARPHSRRQPVSVSSTVAAAEKAWGLKR